MDEFRAALAQYLIGSSDVADLEQAFDTALGREGAAPELAAMLDELFQSGRLPHQIYALLKRRLDQSRAPAATPPPGGSASDDRTQFQPPSQAPPAAPPGPSGAVVPPGGGNQAGSPAGQTGEFSGAPAAPGDHEDRTRIMPMAPPGQDATVTGQSQTGAFDTNPTPFTGPTGTGTAGTGPTGSVPSSNWSHPSQWSGGTSTAAQTLDIGTTLKGRFVLDSVIGQGGMGRVFKARDLRKEEAQDRNPFIAVKILNEDFKRHPKALQALQRESRKAQDLAHPNIVTVFDFDRDGDNVFMTMEFLEGEPLDKFTRHNALRGVSFERAMPIVQGLADGLMYAHEKGIVHSDFKPANAYLTKDDVVKIFDFGIARAATRSTDLEGEQTLFDAGAELGALTPAYASCEMIEGGEPDPRDDIYALAVVAYELLAGKHPFDKKSAVVARDNGMVPAPIKSLGRRQWRAILHGLAFERSARTPSVAAFMDEIGPRKLPVGLIVTGGIAAVVLVGAGVLLVPQYLDQRELDRLVSIIQEGSDSEVTATLPTLDALRTENVELFGDVFDAEATRGSFLDYYTRRIRAVWDPQNQRYDYPRAAALLAALNQYVPDSARIGTLEAEVSTERDREILDLYNDLDAALDSGSLIASQGDRNAMLVAATIRQIDPADPRINSEEIPLRFVRAAEEQLALQDLPLAEEIVDQALTLVPNDNALLEVRDQIATRREQNANIARVAELESQLSGELMLGDSPEALQPLRDSLAELALRDPGNQVLAAAREQVEVWLGRQLADLQAARSYGPGLRLLELYEGLASEVFLEAREASLNEVASEYLAQIDQLDAAVQQAVAEDRLDGPDGATALYEQLVDLDATQSQLGNALTRIAAGYSSRAVRAREAEDWSGARNSLQAALALQPPANMIDRLGRELNEIDQFEAIANEQADEERQRLIAQQRQQKIDELNSEFTTLLAANPFSVDSARSALVALRSLRDYQAAPADGPDRVVDRLVERVVALRSQQQWEEALTYSREAMQIVPQQSRLQALEAEILADNEIRLAELRGQRVQEAVARLTALSEAPSFDQNWDQQVAGALADYSGLVGEDDGGFIAMRQQIGQIYLDRAAQLRQDNRLERAAQQLDRAARYAPDLAALDGERTALKSRQQAQQQELAVRAREAEISGLRSRLGAEARAGNVAAAETLLKQLRERVPEDPFLVKEGPELIALGYVGLARGQLGDSNPEDAARLAIRAREYAPDLEAIVRLQQDIEVALKEQLADVTPPATSDPCANPSLVGNGRNPRASCRDMLSGDKRGPSLVVIPSGGPFSKPVAFSRYEITIRDYNTYCELSRECSPRTGRDDVLPLTGVSAEEAQAFVSWLGNETGASYRIPTPQEWQYAANANGQQPKKNFNCEVRQNNQLIKGVDLLPVNSGDANGWGLKNYVGNAQEWVRAGSGWEVRGGSHATSMLQCDIDLSDRHSGKPDKVTGFRVLRELG